MHPNLKLGELADIAIARMKMNKEEQRWVKIGRLHREFHKGDVVFHTEYGYGEVIFEPTTSIIQVEWVNMGIPHQGQYPERTLELIAPFQSRFDWCE